MRKLSVIVYPDDLGYTVECAKCTWIVKVSDTIRQRSASTSRLWDKDELYTATFRHTCWPCINCGAHLSSGHFHPKFVVTEE